MIAGFIARIDRGVFAVPVECKDDEPVLLARHALLMPSEQLPAMAQLVARGYEAEMRDGWSSAPVVQKVVERVSDRVAMPAPVECVLFTLDVRRYMDLPSDVQQVVMAAITGPRYFAHRAAFDAWSREQIADVQRRGQSPPPRSAS